MKIFLDECALNKLKRTIAVAKPKGIPIIIYHNPSVEINSPDVIEYRVDNSKEAADLAIFNACKRGDIVVTNDAGLAAMILGKHAACMNTDGVYFSKKNINCYLTSRHILKRNKAKGKNVQRVSKQMKYEASKGDRPKFDYSIALNRLIKMVKEWKNVPIEEEALL